MEINNRLFDIELNENIYHTAVHLTWTLSQNTSTMTIPTKWKKWFCYVRNLFVNTYTFDRSIEVNLKRRHGSRTKKRKKHKETRFKKNLYELIVMNKKSRRIEKVKRTLREKKRNLKMFEIRKVPVLKNEGSLPT
jgi:hypothetical protein